MTERQSINGRDIKREKETKKKNKRKRERWEKPRRSRLLNLNFASEVMHRK